MYILANYYNIFSSLLPEFYSCFSEYNSSFEVENSRQKKKNFYLTSNCVYVCVYACIKVTVTDKKLLITLEIVLLVIVELAVC